MQKERQVAVLYVGEDLDVLLELCDKVKSIVKEKTGYVLELEPVILG